MNSPLDPERIANENTTEEAKIDITSEKEAVASIENNTEETVVNEESTSEEITEVIPVKEEVEEPEEKNPEPEEKVEEPKEEVEEKRPAIESLNKVEITDRLAIIVEEPFSEKIKHEVDSLKLAFYKQKDVEINELKQSFINAGGLEEEFKPEADELEEKFKELLAIFRKKKAELTAELEKIKEKNLEAKKAILEKLKELIESQDDFYKVYNEFRKLQQQWKEIKQVPQAAVNDLWKDYQLYTEKFYDLLKINNEMRDYDFKKNLELKQALSEAVERLEEEKDIISAFYQLQKLHQEWREIGPVARELREEVWSRFKKASSVINKKHQDHFDSLRETEQQNLEEKTVLCEEMEAIDYTKLTTFKEWDEQNKKVLEYQNKWKLVGFAPKKANVKIFERFRVACDTFFSKKADFYKEIKGTMDVNFEKKKVLCEKVEELKDSQDWKETTDKLIALQKEWKTIGPVSRKQSDVIWKRFIGACDYFFEQKNIHFSSQKTEEVENLKKKKEIIAAINAIDETLAANEAIVQVRALMQEFNSVGFVPFREKDKIYKEYHAIVNKHFDRLKIDESERHLQSFKSNLSEMAGDGKSKNKLLSERERLMRSFERLKNDIQTYENNIGFLSISSKGGGGLVKEMNQKMEALKGELDLIVKKIEVVDENLGFEKQ